MISVSNIASGAAINPLTRADNTTASIAQNSGNIGEPGATGGGNTGDLALGRVLLETNNIANQQGGHLPIIGSSAFARIAAAAIPGGNVNIVA